MSWPDPQAVAQVAAALEQGASVVDAAEAGGVSKRTVYAWNKAGVSPIVAAWDKRGDGRRCKRPKPTPQPSEELAGAPESDAPHEGEPGDELAAKRALGLEVLAEIASDAEAPATARVSAAKALVSLPAPTTSAPIEMPDVKGQATASSQRLEQLRRVADKLGIRVS